MGNALEWPCCTLASLRPFFFILLFTKKPLGATLGRCIHRLHVHDCTREQKKRTKCNKNKNKNRGLPITDRMQWRCLQMTFLRKGRVLSLSKQNFYEWIHDPNLARDNRVKKGGRQTERESMCVVFSSKRLRLLLPDAMQSGRLGQAIIIVFW
jgi:hypothetical protein